MEPFRAASCIGYRLNEVPPSTCARAKHHLHSRLTRRSHRRANISPSGPTPVRWPSIPSGLLLARVRPCCPGRTLAHPPPAISPVAGQRHPALLAPNRPRHPRSRVAAPTSRPPAHRFAVCDELVGTTYISTADEAAPPLPATSGTEVREGVGGEGRRQVSTRPAMAGRAVGSARSNPSATSVLPHATPNRTPAIPT